MLSSLETGQTWVRRGSDPSTSVPAISPRIWHSAPALAKGGPRSSVRRDVAYGSGLPGGLVYHGEYNFNLSEYVVILDKPLGLTLAPDPGTGRILVQQIHDGSPAADCKLIKVGDVLKSCSAVYGDDMWECTDLQRTVWAVNNRVGKVRLILERAEDVSLPMWYLVGKEGVISSGAPAPQLPVKLGSSSEDDILDAISFNRGHVLTASFHRCYQDSSQVPVVKAGKRMRLHRRDELRHELEEARVAQEVEFSSSVARMVASSKEQLARFRASSQHVNGNARRQGPAAAVAAATAVASQAHNNSSMQASINKRPEAAGEKKVVQVTPWLLVSTGRLMPQELVRIATRRALDSLLELNLHSKGGKVVVGSQHLHDSQEEAILQVVAGLHRLTVRRRFTPPSAGQGSCHVLLHCDAGMEAQAGLVVAGWLHWCMQLDEEEALTAAEIALNMELDERQLQDGSQWLVDRARKGFRRVVLRWPYGGISAEVSGEVVGGWTKRVPMHQVTEPKVGAAHAHGLFELELSGMRPGRYHYKYIIDNTWAVDPFAPRDLDAVGNWNNVLEVFPPPSIQSADEEQHFATLQVLRAAFRAKLGCAAKNPVATASK